MLTVCLPPLGSRVRHVTALPMDGRSVQQNDSISGNWRLLIVVSLGSGNPASPARRRLGSGVERFSIDLGSYGGFLSFGPARGVCGRMSRWAPVTPDHHRHWDSMSLAGLLAAVAEDPQLRTALANQPATPDGGERDTFAHQALR